MTRLEEVHQNIGQHLIEIAENFKQPPKITIICRCDWLPDGRSDILLTDDNLEDAIMAIRRVWKTGERGETVIPPLPEADSPRADP